MAALFLPLLMPSLKSDLNFLAVGDWGADLSNTLAVKRQHAAAAGMKKIAGQIKPSFALLLGDNFYEDGIHGDEHDQRFQQTFEGVYNGTTLENIPFYAIAGNHDHSGNVTAQIAYSGESKRWQYPDWYYSKKFNVTTDVSMEIIFFDTIICCGNSDDLPLDQKFAQPPGPSDPPTAEEQWKWLNMTMAASTADYLWIAGHYPVWSACQHGPTAQLVQILKPQLEKHGAHYMSGHDHCQGHIDEGKGPQYIVSGSGEECCYAPSNVDANPAGSIKFFMAGNQGSSYQPMPAGVTPMSGFTSFRATADSMKVVFHSDDGTVLYTTPDIPPRNN